MANTYYESELTSEEIDRALKAISDVVLPTNNGKVLCITNGVIDAKSASTWGGGGYPEPTGTLNISENGLVNVKDYAEANVQVSGGGSGGEGPIYYGTSAPLSSLGSNEDLYIQYQIMPSGYDHTYGIVAEFRKVGGVWVQYEKPALPTKGVHIWTKSTGGDDAAMYVQNGYWDVDNNVFVETGEVESVLYNTVYNWNIAKNCNDIALLAYPSGWQVKASTTITDGTNTYQTDAIAKYWEYRQTVDFYIWKPVS